MDSLIERVVSHRVRMGSLSIVTLLRHRHVHDGFGLMTRQRTDKSTVKLDVEKAKQNTKTTLITSPA